MSNEIQDTFTQVRDSRNGWDDAIDEACRQIGEAEAKIRGLKLSIQTFKEMRRKGEPFLGDAVSQQKSDKAA